MGVGAKRRRKDLMYAKQIFELISYFFDGESAEEMDEFKLDEDMVSKILKSYLASMTIMMIIQYGLTSLRR